jgi:hypothetical protein
MIRSSKEQSMADDVNERHLLSCGWDVSSLFDAPCRLDLNDRVPGDREVLLVPPSSTVFSLLASFFDAALPFPALLVDERMEKNLLIFKILNALLHEQILRSTGQKTLTGLLKSKAHKFI